ncbi:MAG TPA: hypothetical protein PLQ04_01330 [Lachnospiraceae bacterium]|nr:hypothetical protein [Lachnospiraceae bacterium]
MIGGAFGAAVAAIMNVYATANGITGIFGFLITTNSLFGYLLTIVVASAVAFGCSWFLYKDAGEVTSDSAPMDQPVSIMDTKNNRTDAYLC